MRVLVERSFWPWRFECQGCLSDLEAEQTDVRSQLRGPRWGTKPPAQEYYVVCPVCQRETMVPDGLLNAEIKRNAQTGD